MWGGGREEAKHGGGGGGGEGHRVGNRSDSSCVLIGEPHDGVGMVGGCMDCKSTFCVAGRIVVGTLLAHRALAE